MRHRAQLAGSGIMATPAAALRQHLHWAVVSLLLCITPQPLTAGSQAAAGVSPDQWRADLRDLAAQLQARHANLFHTISRQQFDELVNALDRRLPGLARHEAIVELARIVAAVGDGHTRIALVPADDNGFRQYPIRVYGFQDGFFVQAIDRRYAEWAGARVIRLGRLSVDEAYARVSEVANGDNESQRRGVVGMLFAVPEVLHALNIVSDMESGTYVLEDRAGRRSSVTLAPVPHARLPWINFWRIEPPLDGEGMRLAGARQPATPAPRYLRDPGRTFWLEYLPERAALYVQLNGIADSEDETLRAFAARVVRLADSLQVEKLILDLRQNGGGNNLLNLPLVHGVIRSDRLNRRGAFFVIIGRHTFSAAQNLVSSLETHTNALFVGEPTGGRPNHYGDARPFTLPHSGLVVRASTLFWQDALPFDDRPWKAPTSRRN